MRPGARPAGPLPRPGQSLVQKVQNKEPLTFIFLRAYSLDGSPTGQPTCLGLCLSSIYSSWQHVFAKCCVILRWKAPGYVWLSGGAGRRGAVPVAHPPAPADTARRQDQTAEPSAGGLGREAESQDPGNGCGVDDACEAEEATRCPTTQSRPGHRASASPQRPLLARP